MDVLEELEWKAPEKLATIRNLCFYVSRSATGSAKTGSGNDLVLANDCLRRSADFSEGQFQRTIGLCKEDAR